MGGGSESVSSDESSSGQTQKELGRGGLGDDQPSSEEGEEAPSITDFLNKGTLRLLEFLVDDRGDERYSLGDIAAELGVHPSTISRAYRPLLDVGILVEYEYPRGNTGRPIIVIGLDEDNRMVEVLVKWLRAFKSYLQKMEVSE